MSGKKVKISFVFRVHSGALHLQKNWKNDRSHLEMFQVQQISQLFTLLDQFLQNFNVCVAGQHQLKKQSCFPVKSWFPFPGFPIWSDIYRSGNLGMYFPHVSAVTRSSCDHHRRIEGDRTRYRTHVGKRRCLSKSQLKLLILSISGVNIAVCAKSVSDTPNLPGTIYSVAKEVESLGVEALPLKCDVRSDEDLQNVVQQTIKKWGRIDILINNAGTKRTSRRIQLCWFFSFFPNLISK